MLHQNIARGISPAWCNTLDLVHEVGLARDLTYTRTLALLGPFAAQAPKPGDFVALLHAYYAGADDKETSSVRRRQDEYAAVRMGEPMTATKWLQRLVAASPHLGGISVCAGESPALRCGPAMSRLFARDGWVELADMVDAANEMLAGMPADSGERFVPLTQLDDCEGYVCVGWAAAALLDEAGLLEEDWADPFFTAPLAAAA